MALTTGYAVWTLALLGAACSEQKQTLEPGESPAALSAGDRDAFSDPPPNAPPPPASCGDMNGGGDQHVDFPTLMAAGKERPARLPIRSVTQPVE